MLRTVASRSCQARLFTWPSALETSVSLKRPWLHRRVSSSRRWAHGRAHTSTQNSESASRLDHTRNIGIIAHVDAGKTTTTERMLYASGLTRHQGKVDDGDTVTDYLPMEKDRGITIQSAAISFNWPRPDACAPHEKPKTINLIDTPGHQDFQYEVLRCMHVLDGAVCIIDGVEGVEAHTERVWAAAQQFNIPRIVFVNKMDRDGASFKKSVLDIASRLNAWPLVCQIPWYNGDSFSGIIDIVTRSGIRWSTNGVKKVYTQQALQSALELENPALLEEIATAREQLIEAICAHDDRLTEDFLELGLDLPADNIKQSLRRVISNGSGVVVPVLAGASFRNIGVEPLLDAVIDYLPSPGERPPLTVRLGQNTRELADLMKAEAPATKKRKDGARPEVAVASVFKVLRDPHRGMLSFVRVYQGSFEKNMTTWNTTGQLAEKPLSILQIAADKTHQLSSLSAGSIGALTGLKEASTGDTIIAPLESTNGSSLLKDIQIRPADIPPAVAFFSIEASSLTGEQALERALTDMSREDPSLRWSKDDKTSLFTLSGMGSLHLEVAIDNLKQHKVEAMFGQIQVDYKETITSQSAKESYIFDRSIMGKTGKVSCSAIITPIEDYNLLAAELSKDPLYGLGFSDITDPKAYHQTTTSRSGNTITTTIINPLYEKLDFDTITQPFSNGAFSALYRGPKAGFPLYNCHISLTFDARTDSFGPASTTHFSQAAYHAVRNATKKAHADGKVALLEPLMRVNISCPEAVASQVRHDLASRAGGRILETEVVADAVENEGRQIDLAKVYAPPDPYEMVSSLRGRRTGGTRMLRLVAMAPLKEMMTYDRHLRSITEGRHALQMELASFARVAASREKALARDALGFDG